MNESQIKEIVKSVIAKDEKLGENAGGSGHLSHVDYTIDFISDPQKVDEGYKVDYNYTVFITTEFTIEPDNPPYKYPYEKSIILSKSGKLLSETEKRATPGGSLDFEIPEDFDLDE